MDGASPRRSRLPAAAWERFVALVAKRGARPPADRWYAIRAEQFEKALRGKDLRACTAADVGGYLAELGAQQGLKDWQFSQVVESLEIMLVGVLKLPWAAEFDWGFWRDSARRLPHSHATIARQSVPAKTTGTPGRLAILEAVSAEIRRRNYSIRTEQTYLQWIRRFVVHCGGRDPNEAGADEVKSFLERLAVMRNVAASTQNQALSALVFLYRDVLEQPLELGEFKRAKRPRHLPVVLTRKEVHALLG